MVADIATNTTDTTANAAPPSLDEVHKPLVFVPLKPPPEEQRACRGARFAKPGEKKNRYTLPDALQTTPPVGFRTRLSLTPDEAQTLLQLASLPRPTAFVSPGPVTEQRLFEEASLGVLLARQSTNYRGWREVVVGDADADLVC